MLTFKDMDTSKTAFMHITLVHVLSFTLFGNYFKRQS